MKDLMTVPASYSIMSKLDYESMPIGIELCGRICYKSEDKITKDSAIGFCRKMTEHKHNSTLEMRAVSFLVTVGRDYFDHLTALMPKFLVIDDLSNHDEAEECVILVTGSVRAFREMVMLYPDCDITTSISIVLANEHPCFFEDIDQSKLVQNVENIKMIDQQKLDDFLEDDPELWLRHRHIAVRFIVNRAVTHEMVRHRPCAFLQESQRYCRYSEDKFGNRVTFIEPTAFWEKGSDEYVIWQEDMLASEERYLKLLKTSSPQAARTVLPNSCKTEIIIFCNMVEWNHIFHMRTSKAAEPSMREVMIPLQKDFQVMFPGHNFDKRFPENFA